MQPSYPVVQWSVLVSLRLLMGCQLLYAGLATLGAFGWEAVTQPHPGSLLLRSLVALDPQPGLIAVAEGAFGTVFSVLGCTLVLGWYAREATAIAVVVVAAGLLVQLALPSFVSFAEAVTLMSDDINACATLAVLLAFPTSHVFGIDALQARPQVTGKPMRAQARGTGR